MERRGPLCGWRRVILAASEQECVEWAPDFRIPERIRECPQAYALRVLRDQGTVLVLAGGPAGCMYGGLEIAEVIEQEALDALRDRDAVPHIARRGVKFKDCNR